MNQSFAVWTVIVLSLLTANLPFVVQRPFLVLPWTQAGEPPRPWWLQWLAALVFFCLLLGLAYVGFLMIGRAYFMASDLASVALFVGQLALVFGLTALFLPLLASCLNQAFNTLYSGTLLGNGAFKHGHKALVVLPTGGRHPLLQAAVL